MYIQLFTLTHITLCLTYDAYMSDELAPTLVSC